MCNKGEGDFLGFDSLKVSIIIFPFVLFIDSIVKARESVREYIFNNCNNFNKNITLSTHNFLLLTIKSNKKKNLEIALLFLSFLI